MPLAKIHVLEGQYDSDRLNKVSAAIQASLMNTLGEPPEEFFHAPEGHQHSGRRGSPDLSGRPRDPPHAIFRWHALLR